MERDFNRYKVIKMKDGREALSDEEKVILDLLCDKVERYRIDQGKIPLKCVVVESHWEKEYEQVWRIIEDGINAGKD